MDKLKANLQHYWHQLYYLALCGDTRPATIFVAISGFHWTWMALWPGETIDRPTYTHMKEIIPTDEGWALVFLTVTVLQMARLFSPPTRNSRWLDFGLKTVAAALYTFTAVACMLSIFPLPMAMADNLTVAMAALWDLSRWESRRGCGGFRFSRATCGECPLQDRCPKSDRCTNGG